MIKKNREEITVPKDAYITFENEASYDVGFALIGAPDEQTTVDGYKMELSNATEPSNIEYKFLYRPEGWRLFKQIVFFIGMTIAILMGGAILFLVLKASSAQARIFPTTNCEHVMDTMHEEGQDHHRHEEILLKLARDEWWDIQNINLNLDVDTISTAHLQCYCLE